MKIELNRNELKKIIGADLVRRGIVKDVDLITISVSRVGTVLVDIKEDIDETPTKDLDTPEVEENITTKNSPFTE